MAIIDIDGSKILELNDKSMYIAFEAREFDYDSYGLAKDDEITDKMIQGYERQIRTSTEYKKFIGFLKNELDLTKCSIIEGLDIKKLKRLQLEFHHHPVTLFDMTKMVVEKMQQDLEDGCTLSTFQIARQVMIEHFNFNVGLVPLNKTFHKMAHDNVITIPNECINGNYMQLLKDYSGYYDDETKDRINTNIEAGFNKELIEENKKKFTKNILKYKVTYKNTNGDDYDEE